MIEFFTDEEVEDIALNHVEGIRSLEDGEAKRVMKAYKRVRQDLRDRLDAMAGSKATFTAQKLRGAMLQVDLALDEMGKNLNDDMDSASESAAGLGIEHLIKEIERWNKKFTGAVMPIFLDAVVIASDTANFLFNQRESSLKSYSSMLRGQIARQLTDATIEEASFSEITSRIGQFFLGEEWKLQQIVRTELHNIYSQGKMRGMNQLWDDGNGNIPDLKKTLFHPMDKRTGKDSIWLNAHNPIIPINEPFVEKSTGTTRTYMAPPNRPNDRAILIPFREEWKK